MTKSAFKSYDSICIHVSERILIIYLTKLQLDDYAVFIRRLKTFDQASENSSTFGWTIRSKSL